MRPTSYCVCFLCMKRTHRHISRSQSAGALLVCSDIAQDQPRTRTEKRMLWLDEKLRKMRKLPRSGSLTAVLHSQQPIKKFSKKSIDSTESKHPKSAKEDTMICSSLSRRALWCPVKKGHLSTRAVLRDTAPAHTDLREGPQRYSAMFVGTLTNMLFMWISIGQVEHGSTDIRVTVCGRAESAI